MTVKQNLAGLGISSVAAQAMTTGFLTNSIDVTGKTAQGNLVCPSDFCVVTTSPGSAGLTLPTGTSAGDSITIANHGASTMLVWPPVGGKIANGSANASVNVSATKTAVFTSIDGLNFTADVGA